MKEAEVSTETSSEQEEPGGNCTEISQGSSAVAMLFGTLNFQPTVCLVSN